MTETKDDVAGLVASGRSLLRRYDNLSVAEFITLINLLRPALDALEVKDAALSLSEARTTQAVAAAYEDAAKVAEGLPGQRGNSPEHLVGRRIATAIRARAATAGEK